MEVLQAPNPKLRVKTKSVKKISKFLSVAKEMIKLTKSFVDPQGVGLASTQIGRDEQFFISLSGDKTFKAFFNPKILKFSKKKKLYFEGCLSLLNFWGEVERSAWVDVSYQDETGHEIRERLTGFPAHVFQHEVDHLNGKLFVDHVLEDKTKLFKVVGKDRAGADIFEEIKIHG